MTEAEHPILLVDDEASVLTALDRTLRKVGYSTVRAGNAEAALELARSQPLMCAITDLRMPGIGGHGFVRRLQDFAPDLPVIVMSGNGDMDDVVECLRQGVADYISKPWCDPELRAAIGRALERRKRQAVVLGLVTPHPSSGANAFAAPLHSTPVPSITPPPHGALARHPTEGAPSNLGTQMNATANSPARADLSGAVRHQGAGAPEVSAQPQQEASPTARPVSGAAGGESSPRTLESVLKRLKGGELPIPSPPRVAMAARTLAQSEHGSAVRMKELLEQDGYLAARIIKLANSSYYTGYGRVTDLKAAVARIGFREIAHLVDALILQQFHSVQDARFAEFVEGAWRHTWLRAVAMRFLAQEARTLGVSGDEAYLAGLFCDIGKPFLSRVLAEIGTPLEEAKSFVAEHHSALSGAILESWKLPPTCVDLATRHHSAGSPSFESPLMRLLWAADTLAVGCGSCGDTPEHARAADAHKELGVNLSLLPAVQSRLVTYAREHASLTAREDGDGRQASS